MYCATRRALLMAALLSTPLFGQARTATQTAKLQLTVKLATIAPTGTTLFNALDQMRHKWMNASNGGVDAIIFADGTQGGEAESVDKMRQKRLQAAMLSVTGLMEIDKSASALQNMPMMFRSLDEVDYVRDKLTEDIKQRFKEKGFIILFWGDIGWVRFFSKQEMIHPDQLKKMKVFTWAGDSSQSDIMKAAGYQPVSLETSDILSSLQTGIIDAVPCPPLAALAGQFDRPAKHMLEINWAPLVGGLVIRKDTWDAFPQNVQDTLLQAAKEAGEQIKQKGRAESDQDVQKMVARSKLIVHHVTPEVEAEWQKTAEEVYGKIRGPIVPADMFDRVRTLLDEYRSPKRGGK
jgi:TRAP-type C4-dicarboxylate transport system substrate-binding protein